jgi:hypothetical protein
MTDVLTGAPDFDHAALIAELRAGRADRLDHAYRLVFASELGRLVLADHLASCGFGDPLGADNLAYKAGMIDGALNLANKARFDRASLTVAIITDQLEGNQDEPAFNYSAVGDASDLAAEFD